VRGCGSFLGNDLHVFEERPLVVNTENELLLRCRDDGILLRREGGRGVMLMCVNGAWGVEHNGEA
jgi:hypothetical protein